MKNKIKKSSAINYAFIAAAIISLIIGISHNNTLLSICCFILICSVGVMDYIKEINREESFKILKYTEYKKQQALWLQREDVTRSNRADNTEQFCIQCYMRYLDLIGFKDIDKLSKMEDIMYAIVTYHYKGDSYITGYDKNVADNVNELMDEII